MIFDGLRWKISPLSIPLLPEDWTPPEGWPTRPYHIQFGRAIRPGKPVPQRAVKSRYTWDEEDGGQPVFVVPVKPEGWGLTNKMYGADGYAYLMLDGKVYVRRHRKTRKG